MKKLLIALLVLLALGTASIYIFIPKQIVVGHIEPVYINDHWAFTYLSDTSYWKKWWPKDENVVAGNNRFGYKNQQFSLDSLYYNAVTISIAHDGNINQSKLAVLPLKVDEVRLGWECIIESSMNPFTRLKQYQDAISIKQGMREILSAYKKWLGVTENVYGFNVVPAKIIDTILVAKRAQFKGSYPTPVQIDSLLNIIRLHISKYGVAPSGLPMLNVFTKEGIYDVQVAIPVSKVVPETEELRIKRMFPGNALVAKFKGGPYTIQKAYEACETFRMLHSATSPAIPFQSMVTDRAKESDTSKWETILYYPVM